MRIVDAHFPPFVEGVVAGTNYAVSFLVLQHFHFALATKQPSVTAATFAEIVRATRGQARLERLAEFISRITRSQLASAAGNLVAVCLGSILFAQVWALVFSRPYLATPSAEYVYETLNPLASGTMLYAALTGVILWISALAGGWFENFAVFNHVPAAIALHPVGRKFGRERKSLRLDDLNCAWLPTRIRPGHRSVFGFTARCAPRDTLHRHSGTGGI